MFRKNSQTTPQILTHHFTETINLVSEDNKITQQQKKHQIKVDQKIPKLGVMFVGWGGNNGTTITAGILANK